MRVPSYRRHSSGQARVTIHGRDHLLGKHGIPASKERYGRLIAEYAASGHLPSFGQSINPQMARLLRVIKWAVSEDMIPPANYLAMRCVEPLKKS